MPSPSRGSVAGRSASAFGSSTSPPSARLVLILLVLILPWALVQKSSDPAPLLPSHFLRAFSPDRLTTNRANVLLRSPFGLRLLQFTSPLFFAFAFIPSLSLDTKLSRRSVVHLSDLVCICVSFSPSLLPLQVDVTSLPYEDSITSQITRVVSPQVLP